VKYRDLFLAWRVRARVARLMKHGRPVRVVLGAGGLGPKDWIHTEKQSLDVTDGAGWIRVFKRDSSIDRLLAEHVWEHLTDEEARRACRNCFRFLRPGGRIRIAVPDGLHPDSGYIEFVKPGGCGPGADDHKVLYTYLSLAGLWQEAGFRVEVLEHFDEEGGFHHKAWDPADGSILRSMKYDRRNVGGALNYTSIILDAVRPEATDRVSSL
jgi:predicted SAM-dependent methyltransferase